MKTFFKLSLLVLITSFYSCNKEDIATPENENSIQNEKLTSTRSFSTNTDQAEEGTIANVKQWVAYLTAQAILNDEAAEQDFLESFNIIVGVTNTINFTDLIDENNTPFLNAFEAEFVRAHDVFSCTGGQPGFPNGLPTPPNPPEGLVPPTASELFVLYRSALINDHNFEVYLPNGYQEDTDLEIISWVDELSTSAGNPGYRHLGPCEVYFAFNLPQASDTVIIIRK